MPEPVMHKFAIEIPAVPGTHYLDIGLLGILNSGPMVMQVCTLLNCLILGLWPMLGPNPFHFGRSLKIKF